MFLRCVLVPRSLPGPVLGTPVGESSFFHKLQDSLPSLAPGVQQEQVAPWHRSVCVHRLSLPQAAVPPGQSFPFAESPVLSDFSLPTSGYLNLHYKAAGSKQKVPCPRLGEGSGHAPGAGPGSSEDAELTAGADTDR